MAFTGVMRPEPMNLTPQFGSSYFSGAKKGYFVTLSMPSQDNWERETLQRQIQHSSRSIVSLQPWNRWGFARIKWIQAICAQLQAYYFGGADIKLLCYFRIPDSQDVIKSVILSVKPVLTVFETIWAAFPWSHSINFVLLILKYKNIFSNVAFQIIICFPLVW